MSFGSFILGTIIFIISFLIVRFANQIELSMGDFGDLIGFKILSWRVVGIIGLILGFIIAFGLLQELLALIFGHTVLFGTPLPN